MTIKELRNRTGLSQAKFGQKFHIPVDNISNWEQGAHNPPEYVFYMIEKLLEMESRYIDGDDLISKIQEKQQRIIDHSEDYTNDNQAKDTVNGLSGAVMLILKQQGKLD